jgi:hypothetical protein
MSGDHNQYQKATGYAMNERIRLLAEQASMIVGEANGFDKTKLTPGELKFAQLIVRDCRDMFVVRSISWNLLNEKLEQLGVDT